MLHGVAADAVYNRRDMSDMGAPMPRSSLAAFACVLIVCCASAQAQSSRERQLEAEVRRLAAERDMLRAELDLLKIEVERLRERLQRLVAPAVPRDRVPPTRAAPMPPTNQPAGAIADAPLDERQQRLWAQHWRRYVEGFAEVDGEFYALPSFDPQRPSSLRKSRSQLQRTYELEWQTNYGDGKRELQLPDEDIDIAQRVLPRWSKGEYGHILSGMVDGQAHPAGGFTISSVQIAPPLDHEARFRQRNDVYYQLRDWHPTLTRHADEVHAFRYTYREQVQALQQRVGPTARLVLRGFGSPPPVGVAWSGERGDGIHVALIDERDGMLVGVPVAAFRQAMSEEAFTRMLVSRGMTRGAFVEFVVEPLRRGGEPAEVRRQLADRLFGDAPERAAEGPAVGD